ncbi:hypothetical protein WOSG25_041430 [Weissella oryzae SG25]|uniref:HTH cro/C1-type domain-containing protein n=1 Tax=Weissella oryzae (strain DSM 25784 / JCM 18191 / LMG 30913 / SG25) TaxID=1329250 RepID=A0A069CTG9_WEIOS|nr:hypothetical protein [Weissella oryzae]GAK30702.1 hypothetical protein WOSG25_041430 [Weissella oryzae SG25]
MSTITKEEVRKANWTIQQAQQAFANYFKDSDFTTDELAKLIGTSRNYVTRIIAGDEKTPAAKKHLKTFFEYTHYNGVSWLER